MSTNQHNTEVSPKNQTAHLGISDDPQPALDSPAFDLLSKLIADILKFRGYAVEQRPIDPCELLRLQLAAGDAAAGLYDLLQSTKLEKEIMIPLAGGREPYELASAAVLGEVS